jgi:hypothetical protein
MNETLQKAIDTYKDDLQEILDSFKAQEIGYERALNLVKAKEKEYDSIFETFPEEEIEFDYASECAWDVKYEIEREYDRMIGRA